MSYTIVTDKIEVRSLEENNKPRYVVRGTALIANKKHIYEYTKNPDGSYKTLKSMFTPHCIQSIKEQSKHKKLFVDVQHEFARDSSIKAIIKGKVTPEEEKQIDNMLKRKKLPLAKLNDIEIYDDKMDIDTELNPMFQEVDEDSKRYFDAVWYSLQNKYLNGISLNFGDFTYATDESGDTKIDDVEVLGFSYVDSPAEHENSIYEVAIRAVEEGIHIRTGEKMEEDKLKLEKDKLDVERKKIEEEKVELQKQKDEIVKQAEIEKQAAEHKRLQIEIDAKAEALKKAEEEKQKLQNELNSVKGQVKTGQDKYGTGQGQKPTPEFFKEKLKEITSKHDETMEVVKKGKLPLTDNTFKGFTELSALSAKANNLTADLDKEDADYIKQNRLLDRGRADIVIPRTH